MSRGRAWWRGFTEDLLTAYADDELDVRGRAEVERELARSPELRAVLEDVQHARALVRALPSQDLDAESWQRIMATVAADVATAAVPAPAARFERRRTSTRLALAGFAVAAAAAVIVVVAVVVPTQRVAPDVASLARASALGDVGGTAKAQAPDRSTTDQAGRSQSTSPEATTTTTAPRSAKPAGWRYLGRKSAPDGGDQHRYSNDVDTASVFVHDGSVEWESLPRGRRVSVAGHRARQVEVTAVAIAIVWDDGGSVFTCVGTAPEVALLHLARAFSSGRVEGAEDDGLAGFLLGPFRWR